MTTIAHIFTSYLAIVDIVRSVLLNLLLENKFLLN